MLSAAALCAPGAPAAVRALPEPPPAFEFRGSHGYRGIVFVGENKDHSQAGMVLFVAGPGGSVLYSAPAIYEGPGAFRADLGGLGSLDLHFVPDGGSGQVHSRCSDDGFTFPSGSFEGSFHFHGERGYTRVDLASVKPSPTVVFDLLCPGIGFGGSIPGPGAELNAVRHAASGAVELAIRKKGPRRRAYFTASIEERRGSMGIIRSVGAYGSPDSFSYARRGQRASVSAPAPFSGAAALRRVPGHGMRLLGDLKVDFPGRSGVRLTGPKFHAHLEHIRLSGPIAHSGSVSASGSAEAAGTARAACPATLVGPWTSSSRSPAPC
jgi:hypothetical protein